MLAVLDFSEQFFFFLNLLQSSDKPTYQPILILISLPIRSHIISRSFLVVVSIGKVRRSCYNCICVSECSGELLVLRGGAGFGVDPHVSLSSDIKSLKAFSWGILWVVIGTFWYRVEVVENPAGWNIWYEREEGYVSRRWGGCIVACRSWNRCRCCCLCYESVSYLDLKAVFQY